jgi:hypothetical protein
MVTRPYLRHASFSYKTEIKHLRNNEKSFMLKTSFLASCSDDLRLVEEDKSVLGTLNVICKTKTVVLISGCLFKIIFAFFMKEKRAEQRQMLKRKFCYLLKINLLKMYLLKYSMSCQVAFWGFILLYLQSISITSSVGAIFYRTLRVLVTTWTISFTKESITWDLRSCMYFTSSRAS